jgi:hypothetical protein
MHAHNHSHCNAIADACSAGAHKQCTQAQPTDPLPSSVCIIPDVTKESVRAPEVTARIHCEHSSRHTMRTTRGPHNCVQPLMVRTNAVVGCVKACRVGAVITRTHCALPRPPSTSNSAHTPCVCVLVCSRRTHHALQSCVQPLKRPPQIPACTRACDRVQC